MTKYDQNMANFTTENNTYCFRIGPAFLDTVFFNELDSAVSTKRLSTLPARNIEQTMKSYVT